MKDRAIFGVLVTPLRQIVDERGAVLHMMRRDSPGFSAFGECYFSVINPGKLKAWKRHSRQTQNLVVPVGGVRFVLCDTRESSPTCGALHSVDLGRELAYSRLTIPPLIWYGFACIGDSPALVTNCADLAHEPGESETLPADNFGDARALTELQRGLIPP